MMASSEDTEKNNFVAPFVSRSKAEDHGDGYDICHIGLLVVTGTCLYIYERDNFIHKVPPYGPLFIADMLGMDLIKCRKFRSEGKRFYGGRVVFFGFFGRAWKEKLIVMMEMEEYKRFKSFLRTLQEK